MTQPGGSGGGGTSSSFGSAFPTTGTAAGFLASDGITMAAGNLDASGNLKVAVTGAGSGGTSSADRATYTAGTTAGTPQMIARDDSSPGTLAEDKVGIQRGSSLREAYIQIRDAAQNDRGANVDASGNLQVGASALPLPTGAATAANQATGNTSVASIDTKTLQQLSLDYDTGVGTQAMRLVGIAIPASGGAVAGGTTTNPIVVSQASQPLPTGASTETTLAGVLTTSDFDLKVGSLTETAPSNDTNSSGLNGRLQRIAQRITALIALLPAALGAGGGLKVDGSGTALPISVVDGSDATQGITTGTAVVTDVAGTVQQYLRGLVKLIAAGISVAVTAVTPGVGATNLGKAEDAAHTSADTGVLMLATRNDALATTTDTDRDYSAPSVDGQGRAYVVQKCATATLTNVVGSATSVTLLPAANARTFAAVYNDSTAILYVKLGTTASATSFTVPLAASAYYEIPGGYTGRVDGVWVSATGNARVTELT